MRVQARSLVKPSRSTSWVAVTSCHLNGLFYIRYCFDHAPLRQRIQFVGGLRQRGKLDCFPAANVPTGRFQFASK